MEPLFVAVPLADPVSALTHLAAAGAALLATPPLLRRAGAGGLRLGALVLFALCVAGMFTASGVYHAAPPGTPGRELLRRVDHAGVWLAIAACFTPPHALLLDGRWRSWFLGGVWGAALAGAAVKLLWFEALPHEGSFFFLYLALGLTGLVSIAVLRRRGVPSVLLAAALGGPVLLAGAAVEHLEAPNPWPGVLGPHELFHLAVVWGMGVTWWFMHARVATAGRTTLAPA